MHKIRHNVFICLIYEDIYVNDDILHDSLSVFCVMKFSPKFISDHFLPFIMKHILYPQAMNRNKTIPGGPLETLVKVQPFCG